MKYSLDRTLRRVALCLAGGLLLFAGGCATGPVTPAYGHEEVRIPPGSMSVYQLAGCLDMRVEDVSSATAMLRNPTNVVTLICDPGGMAIVNGRRIDSPGGMGSVGGILYVPRQLSLAIGAAANPVPTIDVPGKTRRKTPEADPSLQQVSGTVMIDPGHGGEDPGAISVRGTSEKHVNLAISKLVAARLKSHGVTVVMTRTGDETVSRKRRTDLANARRPDLFVSIHANSFKPNRSVTGFDVFHARSCSQTSKDAARSIASAFKAAGIRPHGPGVRGAGFYVLVRTTSPAVLVETGFLSNQAECDRLHDAGYQRKVANAIARGIVGVLAR